MNSLFRTCWPYARPSPRHSARAASAPLLVTSLLAIAFSGVTSRAMAQQLVVGVVTDRETAAALAGVYVALETRDGEYSAAAVLTDGSGRFVLPAVVGETYRIRAERVGLATEVTEWFLFDGSTVPRPITMRERAVEIEGLSVNASVRTCRLDASEATTVQRWWDEVRKALMATAHMEANHQARLRFERFEREWAPNLTSLRSERILPVDSLGSRPFRSQDAVSLSAEGFVQGERGQRWFLAPDAAVLFSAAFLGDHCITVLEADDQTIVESGEAEANLRLAVEPTRRRPPDIRGVITVDTLSSELRSFDFEYTNLPEDIPRSEAGGHLTFEYLPSGAWIVSEWWIRMPQVGHLAGRTPFATIPTVAGYLERGGRVVEIDGSPAGLDALVGRGTLQGSVYDSLAGSPLADARVSVVGSRLSTRTGADGRFTLRGVPAGRHGATFHHSELTRLGLPSPVVRFDVSENSSDAIELGIPSYGSVASFLCLGRAELPPTILTGTVREADGPAVVPSAAIRASWTQLGGKSGPPRTMSAEGRSGSDGRYVFCDLPSDATVNLSVQTDSAIWRRAGSVELARRWVGVKEIRPGEVAPALVRGTVRAVDVDGSLGGVGVWVLAVTGDTVALAQTDSAGTFAMEVPAGVGHRVVAAGDGYAREASTALTLHRGETLDVDFELVRDPGDVAMTIEGLLVEVEAARTEQAKRLLRQYGQSPASLGRRWIDRMDLDSLPASGGAHDPGVAIQWQGIPGVWVDEGAKHTWNPILCVRQTERRCALIVLNGAIIDLGTALILDLRDLEAIAVLRPEDATTFFGTEGGGGAVLLWTRSGGD